MQYRVKTIYCKYSLGTIKCPYHLSAISMDYPVQLPSQLRQLIKSLRKARHMTQAELAGHLGVGQSRVADIEHDPGAVSVEQLLQVLAMLGAQVVVRDTYADAATNPSHIELPASPPAGEPRGKW